MAWASCWASGCCKEPAALGCFDTVQGAALCLPRQACASEAQRLGMSWACTSRISTCVSGAVIAFGASPAAEALDAAAEAWGSALPAGVSTVLALSLRSPEAGSTSAQTSSSQPRGAREHQPASGGASEY